MFARFQVCAQQESKLTLPTNVKEYVKVDTVVDDASHAVVLRTISELADETVRTIGGVISTVRDKDFGIADSFVVDIEIPDCQTFSAAVVGRTTNRNLDTLLAFRTPRVTLVADTLAGGAIVIGWAVSGNRVAR